MERANHINNNSSFLARDDNFLTALKAYFELFKPGVMSLAIMSSVLGIILAPGSISGFKLFWSILCIIFGAGASGAINMCLEIDIDSQMSRTSKRPLPMNKIDKNTGLEVAYMMAFFSVFFMAFFVNSLSAFLLFLTIFFYGYVYTVILKRKTIYNVVIGGIPGAIPPLIGWAAVTGSLSWASLSFFWIIFFWIPPHSWALALYKVKEYKKVSVPMMPVVKGRRYTIYQTAFYSILLIISTFLPCYFGLNGLLYLYVAVVCNAFLIYFMVRLISNIVDKESHKSEKLFFVFSINYLFILFLASMIDGYFFR